MLLKTQVEKISVFDLSTMLMIIRELLKIDADMKFVALVEPSALNYKYDTFGLAPSWPKGVIPPTSRALALPW